MKKDAAHTPEENADEQLDQLIEEITGKIKLHLLILIMVLTGTIARAQVSENIPFRTPPNDF
jgi:hypothetical protein